MSDARDDLRARALAERALKDARDSATVYCAHLPCSFCGRSIHEVKAMLAGPHGVLICNACVAQCVQRLRASGIDGP